MVEAKSPYKVGILDFNTRRMEPSEEGSIPEELRIFVADLRQYPLKIGDRLPQEVIWFSEEHPWYFRKSLSNPNHLENLRKSDILILSGSGMSAYKFADGKIPSDPPIEEDIKHLETAEGLVRDALGERKWVFGDCFGGQLSIHAVGGKLGRLPNNEYGNTVSEVGFLPHNLTEEGKKDQVFQGMPETFYAAHFHSDFVDKLPEIGSKVETSNGAITVVRSEVLSTRNGYLGRNGLENPEKKYTHAAVVEFDTGARLYHTQFHPEMSTPELADFFIRKAGRWLEQEDQMGSEYTRKAGIIPENANFDASGLFKKFIEENMRYLEQEFLFSATPALLHDLQQYLED